MLDFSPKETGLQNFTYKQESEKQLQSLMFLVHGIRYLNNSLKYFFFTSASNWNDRTMLILNLKLMVELMLITKISQVYL